MLHYNTITEGMQSVSRIIFDTFGDEYYLAGGTALALLIGHRTSIDLDYFSKGPINTTLLKERLNSLFSTHIIQIVYEDVNTLWCSIDGIKVSFISRKDTLLKPCTTEDSFILVSIEDLTIMKLSAICGRDEYKDYFDLACISTITDVRSWPTWWNEVYPQADMTSWLIALGSSEIVHKIPLVTHGAFKDIVVENQLRRVTTEITKFIR